MSELVHPLKPVFPAVPQPDREVLYGDPLAGHAGADAEPPLRRYLRIFLKHRFLVLGAVAGCLALALLVTLLMPREYTAFARIEVAREAPKVVNMEDTDGEQSGGSGLEFYQTQYALLKSRSLSESVVRDTGLVQDPAFLPKESGAALPAEKRLELATRKVNEDTIVTPVPGSSVIDVGFRARDPRLAAKVANSIAQNFIQSNLARRYQSAAYARDFLQQKLDQTRQKLEDSERKAVMYAEHQGLIRIPTGGDASSPGSTDQSLVASQLAQLSTQLTAARSARVEAQAQYEAGAKGSAAAQALGNTTVNALRSQRADLVGQLSKLEADYGPKHPAVIAMKSQIAELDSQLAKEQSLVSTSVSEDLSGKYKQALQAEQELQDKVDALKAQLLGEQTRSIQYNILQRDVSTNRALYEALLQRFKEVGIAGGVGTNNVSIVDSAIAPEHASSPNIPLNLALGLVLGLLIGAAAAIVREQLAEAVILPSEFQSKLRIPLLGTTPAASDGGLVRLLVGPTAGKAAQEDRHPVGQSELAEAYFSILTAVQFSTAAGAPRVMAVTSSQPREGKTTTAMALARGLAATGARVLLIDADLRNPSLHRGYGLERDPGFSGVLTGHSDLRHAWRPTAIERLAVLPAGRHVPNPAELLASPALARIVKEALTAFDNVIFDAPPILGLADAPLLARASEGVVFVIEADRTRATQARQALDRLSGIGAHVLGAVLTKLDPKKAGSTSYSYTYHYGAA